MKKRAIDGLPGLTMQGTKGETGKRGYTTFYSNNESYSLYELSSSGYPVFGTKTIGFYASENSDYINSYISFSAQAFVPIEHDRLINKEEDSLILYEVSKLVTVNVTITETEDFVYEMKVSAEDLADLELDSKSLGYIVRALNNMFSKYKGMDFSFVEQYMDQLKTYTFCILYKLDSLTYDHGGSKGNAIDNLEVRVGTTKITHNVWDGTYDSSSFDVSFGYNIIPNRMILDSSFLIYDDESPEIETIEMINVLDASTKLPINDRTITIKAIYYSDYINEISTEWFNSLNNAGDISNDILLVNIDSANDGDIRNFNLIDDVSTCAAKLLQVTAEDYITGYFVLADSSICSRGYLNTSEDLSHLDLYLVKNDDVLNGEITGKYTFPFINTLSPCITEEDDYGNKNKVTEDLYCITFSVFSNLSKKEREKLAVFARFTKNQEEKLFIVSSVVDNMWNPPEGLGEGTTPRTLDIDSFSAYRSAERASRLHPFGMIENYSSELNFDSEDLGDFELILKYFDEGNDEQTYVSKQIVPRSLIEDNEYTIEIYAYYKSSNAVYQKLYLGEASLEDTIE